MFSQVWRPRERGGVVQESTRLTIDKIMNPSSQPTFLAFDRKASRRMSVMKAKPVKGHSMPTSKLPRSGTELSALEIKVDIFLDNKECIAKRRLSAHQSLHYKSAGHGICTMVSPRTQLLVSSDATHFCLQSWWCGAKQTSTRNRHDALEWRRRHHHRHLSSLGQRQGVPRLKSDRSELLAEAHARCLSRSG